MSLNVTNLVGFGAGSGSGGAASISYADYGTSYSPTNPSGTLGIGTAAANRYVIVAVLTAKNTSGGGAATACTVDGAATTLVATVSRGITSAMSIFITNAPVTTGTTATISATCIGLAHGIATWAAYGVSPAASDTLTSAADDPNGTIDVPLGGILVAVSFNADDTRTCTWTGVTERFDDNATNIFPGTAYGQATGGDATVAAGETGRTVSANWSASSSDVLAAVSWGPA